MDKAAVWTHFLGYCSLEYFVLANEPGDRKAYRKRLHPCNRYCTLLVHHFFIGSSFMWKTMQYIAASFSSCPNVDSCIIITCIHSSQSAPSTPPVEKYRLSILVPLFVPNCLLSYYTLPSALLLLPSLQYAINDQGHDQAPLPQKRQRQLPRQGWLLSRTSSEMFKTGTHICVSQNGAMSEMLWYSYCGFNGPLTDM